MGTAVGNRLYAMGGWVVSGSASVGFIAAALGMCFLRGPWETRWVGWRGGWSVRRRDLEKNGDMVVERSADDVALEEDQLEGERGVSTGGDVLRVGKEDNTPLDKETVGK